MAVDVDLQCATEATDLPAEAEFRRWAELALEEHRQQAELTIRLVDEADSQRLNREFRGQDRPTNVLSFPFEAPAIASSNLLGDLVICAPLVRHEAEAQGKQITAHWAHMVVHGTLHLLGLDHQTDQEASVMEQIEVTVLSKLGFSDPYIDDGKYE
ncbi:MAG: rRNA maturation RNase YbeY [Gammaproteobacteria bacterium]|nr:rRNA maturation RNase YbeY [Gammaproteobacteria bacterium]